MKRLSTLFILSFLIPVITICQAPGIQWQKAVGGSNNDQAIFIKQTPDGGYITAGYSNSINGDVSGNHGGNDMWVVKLSKSGGIQWQKSLGGSGEDLGTGVVSTTDGGYVISGYTNSTNGDVTTNHGGYDYWIVKLSASGSLLWQKTYGGSGDDKATEIASTTDGGFILNGITLSVNGDVTGNHGGSAYGDYWVVKISSTGTLQWQKCLGGTGDEFPQSVAQTADGGYMVFGDTQSNDGNVSGNHGGDDYWLVKLNDAGAIEWQKCYGGTGDDAGGDAKISPDGGYIMTGWSRSFNGDVSGNHGGFDDWVVKVDNAGVIKWQKSYGGTGDDIGETIGLTADGGYVTSGHTHSNDGNISGNHGGWDYCLIKIDSAGTKNWQKSLGGTGDDISHAMTPTSDNGYIMSGYSNSINGDLTGSHGGNDMWVVKLGPDPTITPKVTITAKPGSTICAGTPVTFTAKLVNGDAAPMFQWKKNNINVGDNSNIYVDSMVNNGDSVLCQVTTAGKTANSNKLKMTVNPSVAPSISIVANQGTAVCVGTKITFTATATNGGSNPVYQWQRNGVNVGSNSTSYTDSVPVTGDSINVLLTSNAACVTSNPATSNALKVRVDVPAPIISITSNRPDTICAKTLVTFKAVVTPYYLWKKNGNVVGGNTNTYKDSTLKASDFVQCTVVSSASACNSNTSNIVNSNKLNFTVKAAPNKPSAIVGPANVPKGTSGIYFSVAAVDGVMYAWTLPAGAVIDSGQGGNMIKVTWGTTGGKVSVIAINNCGSSQAVSKTVGVTGKEGKVVAVASSTDNMVVASNDVKLSPNPAGAQATLTFTAKTADKYIITITNTQNKVLDVKSGITAKGVNTIKINTAKYAKGMYFISIATKDGGKKSKELVVGQQ